MQKVAREIGYGKGRKDDPATKESRELKEPLTWCRKDGWGASKLSSEMMEGGQERVLALTRWRPE
jgi:hypothetical protein